MPKASVWLLCLALLAPALLPAQSSVRTTPRALALTHVTVIDATGTAAKPDMTVVITGDRITGLGTFGRIAIPQDAQVIAASGKFLIPGLWDMHSHTAIDAAMKETRLPLLIANGITGVRDMAGLLDAIKQWRREIAAGTLLGPRFVAAGPLLDGPGSIYGPGTKSSKGLGDNGYVVVSTAVAGREDVDELKRDGADFIKVYDRLSRDTYYAIADEAKKQSIPFAGHVPYAVTAAEASDAGQKSIEHMTRMVLAVSSQEAELMPKVAQAASLDGNSTRMVVNRLEAGSIDSYSPAKADRLYALLIKNGTWECPTLVELRGSSFFDDPLVDDPNDPRLKYVSSSMRRNWRQGGVSSKRTAEDFVAAKRIYNKKLEMVRAMERAGVGILAGSDMGNPYVFPGFGLHDELELLVKAGLTPMQSLQTATLNPARYLGKERELGTIEDGKLADLVLLDANPLTDIRNTRKIDAVVVAGKWVDKAQLQAMLAQVEAANRDR